jgi:plasmid stabilization system protein ParE
VNPYFVAPEAEEDLRQIWRHLFTEASLEVADHIQNELVDAFESLSDFPGKGHRRPDSHYSRCALLQRLSVHDCLSAGGNG